MQPDDLEKKIDLYGPLAQAARCLDRFLADERLRMDDEAKKRTAALMARYFINEDQVTDELMLSFLQHYTKRKNAAAIDIDDPASVRMEIKALLDGAVEKPRRFPWAVAAVLIIALALGGAVWIRGSQPITEAQQAELKALVREITEADPSLTSGAVWKTVKDPLHVRSYQDIPSRDFEDSREILRALLKTSALQPAPGQVVNGQ